MRSARVQAARRLAKRAFRARERRFLAEGPQAVREARRPAGTPCWSCSSPPRRPARHGDLVTALAAAGVAVHLVSGEVMAALSQTVTPQGLVAVCRVAATGRWPRCLRAPPQLVTVLAHVARPRQRGHRHARRRRRRRARPCC